MSIAQAQLSVTECNKKDLDLMMTGFVTTGDKKTFNVIQYKEWAAIIALYQEECSHVPGANGALSEAEKNLQDTINSCIAYGQGPDCGVGPVAINSHKSNSQTQPSKSPAPTEELADDPKVFGGFSSTKTK